MFTGNMKNVGSWVIPHLQIRSEWCSGPRRRLYYLHPRPRRQQLNSKCQLLHVAITSPLAHSVTPSSRELVWEWWQNRKGILPGSIEDMTVAYVLL